MIDKKIENIVTKFLTHQASVIEMEQLDVWLQNVENERLFGDYVQTNYAIEHEMRQFDTHKLKTGLQKLMDEEKRTVRLQKMRRIIGYATAAVVTGLLVTGYFLKDSVFTRTVETKPRIVNKNIERGSDKATLTLEDGSHVVLGKGTSYNTQNARSNGEEIVYGAAESDIAKVVYNFLTVPSGGQFHLILSDGTEVWLNSESQLKYPVNFIKGQTRQVEVVYGEGYFVVSPSTEHEGTKFVVFNQFQEIEVLGTEFNIKAYKDEHHIYTTLVEGKVMVSTATTKKVLEPSQQAKLNLYDHTMDIATVSVYNEISWKDGVFSFHKKPLVEIMR